MARPTHTNIQSWEASWDAAVDANFDLIFLTPLPIAEYAGTGNFPDADDYDNCIVADSNNDGDIYVSDGTNWNQIPHKVTALNDLTDNGGGTGGGDTIAAITADSTVKDAVSTLADRINDILARLRSSDVIAT